MAQRITGQHPVEIQLDQLEVIALAHTVHELLLPVVEYEIKLTFEQANSYFTTWHAVRRVLSKMDTDYLNRSPHKALVDFFLGNGQHITKHFVPSDPQGIRVMKTFQVEANLRFGKKEDSHRICRYAWSVWTDPIKFSKNVKCSRSGGSG